MTEKKPKAESGKDTEQGDKKAGREARLASALRRNLLKRKEQRRSRAADGDAEDSV